MVIENVNGTELRFKNPSHLLVVVIGFLFWGIGFLDLLGHESAEPDVLGLYSLPFFLFILLYGSTIVIWFALFLNADLLSRVFHTIRAIQSRTWLALVVMMGIAFSLWVIFEWDRWARLPGLQFSFFGLVVLAALVLLFTDWNEKNSQQVWRRAIAYPLFALLSVEAVLQVVALLGMLPGDPKIGGDFYTYERVYYSGESLRNDFANRYGWYYPDADLDLENKNIVILGSSYVQALPVQSEQQVSVLLAELVNQSQKDPVLRKDVLSIGLPGFGLGPFLTKEYMVELPVLLNADEIVIFFHLGDDFQSPVRSQNSLQYAVSDDNGLSLESEYAKLSHDLTHYYMRGFIAFQLVETIRSNYLTPKVITGLFQDDDREPPSAASTGDGMYNFPRITGYVTDTYTITEPSHAGIKATELKIISDGNNFMFMQDGDADRQESLAVADLMLGTAQEIARAQNVTLRLVTIPVFPEEFYKFYQSDDWDPEIGKYDLFLPEKALVKIAEKHDIPILPMGQHMQENGLSVEEIRALYLSNEQGSFSSKGNEYFAEAIFSTFFAEQK